jgi:hypothetical protein
MAQFLHGLPRKGHNLSILVVLSMAETSFLISLQRFETGYSVKYGYQAISISEGRILDNQSSSPVVE